MTASWLDRIEAAATPHEVVGVAKDYLATWSQSELTQLPDGCRPPAHFVQPADVSDFAFEIVRQHCGVRAGDAKVADLAGFFASAARRIAVLMGDRSKPRLATDIEL